MEPTEGTEEKLIAVLLKIQSNGMYTMTVEEDSLYTNPWDGISTNDMTQKT